MIHHLGAKLLAGAAIAGGALLVKRFWHGPGSKVPVTPHGNTVTPSGGVVKPPAPVPGGLAPAQDAYPSTSVDVVDYTNPRTAYTSIESNTATTAALAQADILQASMTDFSDIGSTADDILGGGAPTGDISSDGPGGLLSNAPATSSADDILSSGDDTIPTASDAYASAVM